MKELTILLATMLTFAACGGTGNHTSQSEIVPDTHAKRYFGALAGATVSIYALDGEQKRLLFTETTSSGETLDAVGNFDPHLRDMQREVRYLYEVHGGTDLDADCDGVIDEHPVPNTRVYRAVYKNFRPQVAWWGTRTAGNSAPSER